VTSSTFCALPWIHLATRPNGDVRVCCTANASGAGDIDDKTAGLVKLDGVPMNVRTHTIEEVWNSSFMRATRLQMLNNQIPVSCKKCFVEESNGIVSKRQWETIVWKDRVDLDAIVASTTDDGAIPVNIPYFDLRLGNLCQLKCIMCSPHDSSSWIKDWKVQYPKYQTFQLKNDQGWDSKFDYTWYKKGSFLDTMRNQAANIRELYFAGGEPLLIPEHYTILRYMVETGASKNCVLRYNSNGLELPDELFELWNHFKAVKFNFSIDDVEDRNEYIRFPTKWETVVKNLHRLDDTPDHVTVNMACAVQLLNVATIPELARWKLSQNFRKISSVDGGGLIGLHLVYFPSYLNVRALPQSMKDIATANIVEFLDSFSTAKFDTDPMGRQRWMGLIKYMNQEDWSDKLPALREYLASCDATRNTSFLATFPNLTL
jgi:hypothetical protein